MTGRCTNTCHNYKAKQNKNRYVSGQKYCKYCAIFITWDGLFCPCCRLMLKTRPSSKKYRERYRKLTPLEAKCTNTS